MLGAYVMDRYIAPNLSQFTAAEIPDISGVEKPWFTNYIMNSALRGEAERPDRQFRNNVLRRLTVAFREYEWARAHTQSYLAALDDQLFADYFWGLYHFEQCVIAAWQVLNTLAKHMAQIQPLPEGPSTERRIHDIAVAARHVEDKGIAGRQVPESETLAVWLANEGVRCKGVNLPYEDLAAWLTQTAEYFAYPLEDPATTRERAAEAQALLNEGHSS